MYSSLFANDGSGNSNTRDGVLRYWSELEDCRELTVLLSTEGCADVATLESHIGATAYDARILGVVMQESRV